LMKWIDRKLKEAMANVEASMAVEGLYVTEEDRALIVASLKGEITHEEFLRLAKERARQVTVELPNKLPVNVPVKPPE
ncbi:antitoxin VbhA family protein, partial [Brevibacillus formosus]|nr:antitoxin VbhA family protein [Brevibacillus formosus]